MSTGYEHSIGDSDLRAKVESINSVISRCPSNGLEIMYGMELKFAS